MNKNQLVLYEIKINPFRSEIGIIKSDSDSTAFNLNEQVIVQINREVFVGQITKIMDAYTPVPTPYLTILRKANESDLARKLSIAKKSQETKEFFEELLKKFKLAAKVILIDWDFNQHKVYCYITSERKINYLLLHETAVDVIKTRVAIKQIGIRDYARSISGLGICGRELCCRVFLHDIQSVTLSMARQQNLYVEPEKISGCCGKLRCCIGYEKTTH
jgi:cell fate regulator YaaT (PSP1 superfamily)